MSANGVCSWCVILSVIDYGLGLTALLLSNLLKLNRVQNKAIKLILRTTKDISTEVMRCLLDLPPMETEHNVEQVKEYLNAMQNPMNQLHDSVKEERRVDWQEKSHGLAKQNSQSGMCESFWAQASKGLRKKCLDEFNHYNETIAREPGRFLLVGCLTSKQHASVSQGRICTDNFTCCHTEMEAADPTFHLTQSQYTDTGPTSPSADPITPGAWQGSHWTANVLVTGMTRSRKNPGASGIRTWDLPLSRRTP